MLKSTQSEAIAQKMTEKKPMFGLKSVNFQVLVMLAAIAAVPPRTRIPGSVPRGRDMNAATANGIPPA